MLDHIRIENFRCFRKLDVPLRPLTVLIGPNDSGKSAFVLALQRAAAINAARDPWDKWRGDQALITAITGRGEGETFTVRSDGQNHVPNALRDALSTIRVFQLPSDGVRMDSSGYTDTGPPPDIQSNGTGIPALLDHLLRRDRTKYDNVIAVMRTLVPGFERLEISTPSPATRAIEFVVDNGLRIPAGVASAGVRLLLFFVALAYHPQPPKLIVVEEPENGVHPQRLGDVIRLLREITQGKHGNHAAQVILTTHSPYLLDAIDLERDQVLVFKRCDDGSRTAEPVDRERLDKFLDEFKLGEVWFNEGEEGLVGRRK